MDDHPIDVTPQLEQILVQCNESREHHTQLGVLRAGVSGDIDQAIAILQHAKTQNRDKAEYAHALATSTGRIKLLAEKALGMPPPADPVNPPSESGLKLPPTLPSFFFFTCVAVVCLTISGGPANTQPRRTQESAMSVRDSLEAQGDAEALKPNGHILAARIYRRILDEYRDSGILVKLADAEYHCKNFGAAIHACTESLNLSLHEARAYRVRGIARLELGDKAGAVADLNEAKKLGDEPATIALGSIK